MVVITSKIWSFDDSATVRTAGYMRGADLENPKDDDHEFANKTVRLEWFVCKVINDYEPNNGVLQQASNRINIWWYLSLKSIYTQYTALKSILCYRCPRV